MVDGTPRCSGCYRFQTEGQMEYVNLGDGRKLCLNCYSIAILDPKLNLEVDKDIPILLVDKDFMDKRQGCDLIDHIRSQKSLDGI
ncbi:LIM domain-containing protein [Prunus dulcis]|uniref:LIM domain-containing protein n=1 Tax=Prunus dulcis TaxID=3755 RepID=A0A4Y1RF64_PRUDU|nr:LIM domain-containing protein [Prunus dulcis]